MRASRSTSNVSGAMSRCCCTTTCNAFNAYANVLCKNLHTKESSSSSSVELLIARHLNKTKSIRVDSPAIASAYDVAEPHKSALLHEIARKLCVEQLQFTIEQIVRCYAGAQYDNRCTYLILQFELRGHKYISATSAHTRTQKRTNAFFIKFASRNSSQTYGCLGNSKYEKSKATCFQSYLFNDSRPSQCVTIVR